jgi:repressor LexA
MRELTPAQQRIFDFVQAELRSGRPVPTLREIAERFNFRSHRAAACHLEAIKRKGFLESERGKARSLRITSPLAKFRSHILDIPIFGSVPAGPGQDREQEVEGCITVDVATLGFKPTCRTFALRVTGDSMIGRHICDGDVAVFEHGAEPRAGQVVAALIDRRSTLKTFVVKNGRPYLRAENPKYPDLIPLEELVIQGLLLALVRKVRE